MDKKEQVIEVLKQFEQRDYKRGGVSLAPEMYNAVAESIVKLFAIPDVRRSALRWWNKLDKRQQNDLEHETFGEGEPWEDNTLNENDIIHIMYKRHYA